jgi:hypothetical protein
MANTYNGWSNYETWLVNLWLDNEEWSQEEVRLLVRRSSSLYNLAYNIKNFVEDGCLGERPSNGLMNDLITAALGVVAWDAIAKSWADAYADDETDEDEDLDD